MPPQPRRRRSGWQRVRRIILFAVLFVFGLDLAAEGYFVSLRWVNPPITAFMLWNSGVLELYLNEAQFGPHLYGVCDAAWYYFGEPPDHMSLDDAYQLMGVLPSSVHAHRLPGGGIDMCRTVLTPAGPCRRTSAS